jgi:hypothetical protein
VRSFTEDITIKVSFQQFLELLTYKQFVVFIHVLFVIIYLVFISIRFLFRTYKKRGPILMIKRLVFIFIVPTLLLYYSGKFILEKNRIDTYKYSWNTAFENTTDLADTHYDIDDKHRGMSVFGWHRERDNDIDELIKNNIEWVAVIPFFNQKDEQTPTISSNITAGQWTRRDSTYLKTITRLHEKNLKVMLKPHLWVASGWRSDLKLDTDEEWSTWFNSYRNVMLHYAMMAEQTNVKLLCIGTELKTSIKKQPDKWIQLIHEIKQLYTGELTYAANWHDEYEFIEFWDLMDYIGIQAYFPLTEHINPSLDEIKLGWQTHKKSLKTFSETNKKPILFTEIGYRSDASATVKPWEWNSIDNLFLNKRSTKVQQQAYEAMFESLWHEPWFAGCYIWQWDTRTKEERAKENLDFSPRFKPAENIIAKWYGNHSSLH